MDLIAQQYKQECDWNFKRQQFRERVTGRETNTYQKGDDRQPSSPIKDWTEILNQCRASVIVVPLRAVWKVWRLKEVIQQAQWRRWDFKLPSGTF